MRPGAPIGVPRTPVAPGPSFSERVSAAAERGLIGKVLAGIGVGVTLIGVALLLVLAAQAGILAPEFRVAGGAVLAVALVGGGLWLAGKPNGRTGAIALAATGIAAGYLDVLAATRIYEWLPIIAGLIVAAVVAAAGLALARRWNSEALGLLVVVPLIVLAPVLTDGLDITLVAFMIILAAATFWVQIGRDWVWLHIVRMAAPIIPLTILPLAAQVGASFGDVGWQFAAAAAAVSLLGFGAALILLRHSAFGIVLTLVAAAATVPTMVAGGLLASAPAAILQLVTAGLILALVVLGDRIAGVTDVIAQIWACVALVLVFIAAVVFFDGDVLGPVLLGLAIVAAAAAYRPSTLSLVCIIGALAFWGVGMVWLLGHAAPYMLASRHEMADAASATILIAALLAGVSAVILAIGIIRAATTPTNRRSLGQLAWSAAALVMVYAITVFTVTAGVLVDGDDGFFAGHVVATTCWVALGAAALAYARRRSGSERTAVITGGLILIGAAMAKLFLFDLATLDGIFRVIVFIVVGLGLLGLGAWYARVLQESPGTPDTPRPGTPRPTPPMPPR